MYMICLIILNRGFSLCLYEKYFSFISICNKNYYNNIYVF